MGVFTQVASNIKGLHTNLYANLLTRPVWTAGPDAGPYTLSWWQCRVQLHIVLNKFSSELISEHKKKFFFEETFLTQKSFSAEKTAQLWGWVPFFSFVLFFPLLFSSRVAVLFCTSLSQSCRRERVVNPKQFSLQKKKKNHKRNLTACIQCRKMFNKKKKTNAFMASKNESRA